MSINCEKCDEWQVAYFLNELSQAEQAQIKAHIQQCDSCRDKFEEMVVIFNALDEQVEQQPSPQLKQNFQTMLAAAIELKQSRVDKASKRLGWFLAFWPSRPVWACSYSLALLFSGMLLGHVLPQSSLGLSPSEMSANQLDYSNIPEDRLIQICAVQNPQYFETL